MYRPITIINGIVHVATDPNAKYYVRRGSKYIPRTGHDYDIACMYHGTPVNVDILSLKIQWPPGSLSGRKLTDEELRALTYGLDELGRWGLKECECGKDKHNFACHTTWCPKYDI